MGSSSSGSINIAMKSPALLEDDGLESVSDMEAGFSGKIAVFSMSSKGNGGSCSNFRAFSPRSLPFSSHPLRHLSIMYDDRCEESRHFLDACFLCKKPLGGNRDIFMYRGDTPFCSEECRQEQIETDEAEEKNRNLSIKAASRKDPKKSPTRGRENQKLPVRTGTVAAG